jgi:hypothetical protein
VKPDQLVVVQAVLAIVNSFLVVGGWIVVHKLTLKREARKKRQDALESFCEQVDAITTLARKFHMAETHNAEEAESLRFRLYKLPRHIKRIGVADNAYTSHLTSFRQAITRSNFESPLDFKQQDVASVVLREIGDAGSELEDCVECAYKELSK